MNNKLNYDSPAALKEFMRTRGLTMQKKFGQNFLINSGVKKFLIDKLELKSYDEVWEGGGGLGTMTSLILLSGAKVKVFEIDNGFCEVLNNFFSTNKNFSIIPSDMLKTIVREAAYRDTKQIKFFGNLPYNISLKLLAILCEKEILFNRILITVQKEAADRLAAKSGTKDYAPLSVLVNYFYNVKTLSLISGASFYPAPNVHSQIVVLTLKTNIKKYPECFVPLLRALFASRRKTIKNNLTLFLSGAADRCGRAGQTNTTGRGRGEAAEEILLNCGIKPLSRAETLQTEDFLRLADYIGNLL